MRHRPVQPTWDCSDCGEPWPCAARREKFLADYVGRRHELRMVLGSWFADALADRPVTKEELYTRFFSWASPRR